MPVHTLSDFLANTADRPQNAGLFELERDRLLQVNLDGMLWIKVGAMVAYRGDIRFEREGVLEHGLGHMLKKAVTGEGAALTRATGRGALYLADTGKKITLLRLAPGETIFVNGADLLAFEPGIRHEIRMVRKLAAFAAGGLFNVRLTGGDGGGGGRSGGEGGVIAVTTHYDPLTLRVLPGQPVYTDPNATVCWSGSLEPEFKTDVQLKTFLGRGSGESIQMKFDGDGFVVVQPYEELPLATQQGRS